MRKYLLDSAPAQAFMHGLSPVRERSNNLSQTGAKIGICIPVFAELMGGIELSQTRERNRTILMQAVRKLYIWPFDRGAAEEYGRIYAFLRRSGRPMPTMDIQIAAIALTLGDCTLVTKDSDFSAIPGLKIEDWS